jgi:SNF family Na+-dependent transporter
MINMTIFVPWDLTFGSGMQTLGALLAVIACAWCLDRSGALRQLATREAGSDSDPATPLAMFLYYWLRYVVPGGILLVGVWWLLTEVLHVTGGV